MATATISKPLLDKALKFSMLSGICATQVVQSVAQNFTKTTLPCKSLVSKCLPFRSVKATSGALALELPPDMVQTPRPTALLLVGETGVGKEVAAHVLFEAIAERLAIASGGRMERGSGPLGGARVELILGPG